MRRLQLCHSSQSERPCCGRGSTGPNKGQVRKVAFQHINLIVVTLLNTTVSQTEVS